MKLHGVELRHVRQIKELALDLSAPLTVIGGPNGVGKTTIQQSILAAMFLTEKKIRDSLVSRFDPDSTPTVVLDLSRGDSTVVTRVTRNLNDDQGTWSEGATVIKKKGQALKEIQKVFPISAAAAALLLWGRQDDMAEVIDHFPSDGHSLLTWAAIRGSGRDPKVIVRGLQKDMDESRKGERGGQVVGTLTQARNDAEALTEELRLARIAREELERRLSQREQAKNEREQTKTRLNQVETEIAGLTRLEMLLEQALQHSATLASLDETKAAWTNLETEIVEAGKRLKALEKELQPLWAQYRVARDQELAAQIEKLRAKIEDVEELKSARDELEQDLKARKRPDQGDVTTYQNFRAQLKEAEDRMEASGVRYKVSASADAHTLRIVEDESAAKEVVLQAGETHQGIVGRMVIEVDGLIFTAGGKEDISKQKRVITENAIAIQALFDRFEVKNESVFLAQAEEKQNLTKNSKEKSDALQVHLSESSVAALGDELKLLERSRAELGLTLSDREGYAGRALPPAADMILWCRQKEGEINQAKENMAALEEKRPSEADTRILNTTLVTLRVKACNSAEACKAADVFHREPTRDVQMAVRTDLGEKRKEHASLSPILTERVQTAAELDGQLKQTCPHRPIGLIEDEMCDAKAYHHHEEVVQKARALLVERIEDKITELTSHVPVELGSRITEHLSQLTCGALCRVQLHPELNHRAGLCSCSRFGAHACA